MKTLLYLLQVLSSQEVVLVLSKLRNANDRYIVRSILTTLEETGCAAGFPKWYVDELAGSLNITSQNLRKRGSLIVNEIASILFGDDDLKKTVHLLTRHRELWVSFDRSARRVFKAQNDTHDRLSTLAITGIAYGLVYEKSTVLYRQELQKMLTETAYTAQDYFALMKLVYNIGVKVTGRASRSRQDLRKKLAVFEKRLVSYRTKFFGSEDPYIEWLFALASVSLDNCLSPGKEKALRNVEQLTKAARKLEATGLYYSMVSYSEQFKARIHMKALDYSDALHITMQILESDPLHTIFAPSIFIDATVAAIAAKDYMRIAHYLEAHQKTYITKALMYHKCSLILIRLLNHKSCWNTLPQVLEEVYRLNRSANYSLAVDTYTRLCETSLAVLLGDLTHARALCMRHRKYFEKRGLSSHVTKKIYWGSLTDFYNVLNTYIVSKITGKQYLTKSRSLLNQKIAKFARGSSSHEILSSRLLQLITDEEVHS